MAHAVIRPFGRRRFILASVLISPAWCLERLAMARSDDVLLIDDFAADDLISALGMPWRGFSDQVMGGISQETIALTTIDGRRCLRLTGDVRLENNCQRRSKNQPRGGAKVCHFGVGIWCWERMSGLARALLM